MEIEIKGNIPITGDCGHQFEVPLAGIYADPEITCPVCGAKDRLTDDQVAQIKKQVSDAAAEFGIEEIRKQLGDALENVTRGSKHLKYTRK